MKKQAEKIADHIKSMTMVEVITHQDADGIASGSIAKRALEREGITHEIQVIKQLDEDIIKSLNNNDSRLYWFTDLGSGYLEQLSGLNAVITDHHELQVPALELTSSARTDLMELSKEIDKSQDIVEYQLNPHQYGKDGSVDLSGAGATYFVARAMNKKNMDLSMLAVIGAVGDLQDVQNGRLIGTNREILNDAESAGLIKSQTDIRFFGRETRPLTRFLMYANDPAIPTLVKNEINCLKFFKDLGIPVKSGEKQRCWVDLNSAERKIVLSELTLILLNNGYNNKIVERLIGEIYLLPLEKPGTELHDSKEFSTLLNSCGRYGGSEIAIAVCLGDRTKALASAKKMLTGHRSNLVSMLKVVKDIGITKLKKFQYFHAKDRINENIIGTITGMVLNSGDVDDTIPLFSFSNSDDGKNIKVSGRATVDQTESGLNLSDVIRAAADSVGGLGGGHNVAAGAQIPIGTESRFIEKLNELL